MLRQKDLNVTGLCDVLSISHIPINLSFNFLSLRIPFALVNSPPPQ